MNGLAARKVLGLYSASIPAKLLAAVGNPGRWRVHMMGKGKKKERKISSESCVFVSILHVRGTDLQRGTLGRPVEASVVFKRRPFVGGGV